MADAHLIGDRLHDDITGSHRGIRDHSEHARSLVVIRREFARPISDVRPLLVLEEAFRRDVESVGVDKGATAHSRSREHDHVLEHVDALDARASQGRGPQEPAQAPGGLGEVGVGEASPRLEDTDAVALLGEAKCRH